MSEPRSQRSGAGPSGGSRRQGGWPGQLALIVAVAAALLVASCARGAASTPPNAVASRVSTAAGLAPPARVPGACRAPASISAAAPAASVVPLQESGPVVFRVNQLGYGVGCPKLALVMVRAGVANLRFSVRDQGGRVVLGGRAGAPQRWNRRYVVYPLAFSALDTPGTYTITFDGHRSAPVRVGGSQRLYRPLADAVLSFLQSQRDGGEVLAGALRRQPSHLADASAAVYRVPAYHAAQLAGPLVATGVRRDVAGGWFDAGDYLKFVDTASFTDTLLLYAARDYGAGLSRPGALRAEARFGTDWLLKMWDLQKRVLYFQVGLGDGNGSSILGDHDLWRLPQADDRARADRRDPAYLAAHRPVFAANAPGRPISPNLAGRMAASFALCAQVFAASDPAYAARCLQAGQALYDQADTHPRGPLLTTVPYAYYAETEWRDDMELGATELYLATAALAARAPGLTHRDPNYYLPLAGRWADAYISARASGQDSLNLYDVSTLAHADLVRVLRTPQAQQYIAHAPASGPVPTDEHALMQDRHDQLSLAARLSGRDPFQLANPAMPVDTVPHALGYAVASRLYDDLSGRGAFEGLRQQQLSWLLGANAWGSSFVVGVGSVFPHCLASQIANLSGSLTGRGQIAAGAVVDGPTSLENLSGLGAPDGYRPCPARGTADPFVGQRGRGMGYLDDVRSTVTSEASDDYAAIALLAAAQQSTTG